MRAVFGLAVVVCIAVGLAVAEAKPYALFLSCQGCCLSGFKGAAAFLRDDVAHYEAVVPQYYGGEPRVRIVKAWSADEVKDNAYELYTEEPDTFESVKGMTKAGIQQYLEKHGILRHDARVNPDVTVFGKGGPSPCPTDAETANRLQEERRKKSEL